MDSESSSSYRDTEDYERLHSTSTKMNEVSDSSTVTDSIFQRLRQPFSSESRSFNDFSSGKIIYYSHTCQDILMVFT